MADRSAQIERFRQNQIAGAMQPSPAPRARPERDDRSSRETGAPQQKTQGSRMIDAAVGGATIGAAAYDLGHQAANAAGAVASTASNAQIGGKVGSKLAARGDAGRSITGISKAVAKASGSNAASVASKVVNSPIVSGLSRFALPILGARMAWNGYEGYQKDGWRGAAMGAADAATFGLASVGASKAMNAYQSAFASPTGAGDKTTLALAKEAGHGMFGSPANAAPAPKGGDARLDGAKQKEFAAANDRFMKGGGAAQPSQQQQQDQGGGNRLRGFANPAVLRAAQEARGVKVSEWAANAEPAEKRP